MREQAALAVRLPLKAASVMLHSQVVSPEVCPACLAADYSFTFCCPVVVNLASHVDVDGPFAECPGIRVLVSR